MKKPTRRQRKAERAKRVGVNLMNKHGRIYRQVWFPPGMWNVMERAKNQEGVSMGQWITSALRRSFLGEGKGVSA